MSDPIKMVFDDGQELAMVRCPDCKCPRTVDYRCSGCEAKAWQRAYHKLHDGSCGEAIASLITALPSLQSVPTAGEMRAALVMAQRFCHEMFCGEHPMAQSQVCKVTSEALQSLIPRAGEAEHPLAIFYAGFSEPAGESISPKQIRKVTLDLLEVVHFIGNLLDKGSRVVMFDYVFNWSGLPQYPSVREGLRTAMEDDALHCNPEPSVKEFLESISPAPKTEGKVTDAS